MDRNQNNGKKVKFKKIDNGRELFYGVIAVASFIVMAVGATFAYFTATANSSNSAIGTRSTTLELEYISYETAWLRDDLIPADTTIVEYSVEHQNDTTATLNDKTSTNTNNLLCVDDYGNSICSVYEFQVRNTANSPQTVSLNVVSEVNEFANLNAMAYELSVDPDKKTDYENTSDNGNGANDPKFKTSAEDLTNGAIQPKDGDGNPIYGTTPIYINRTGVIKTLLQYVESRNESEQTVVKKSSIDRQLISVTDENPIEEAKDRTTKIADDITIDGGETKTFVIVLYVKNKAEDQTKTDAAKSFKGQVVVSTGDGTTGVSGSIKAAGSKELQSGL